MKKLLIIQPWFTAKGHPAQSLLNTARALFPCKDVSYLISSERGNHHVDKLSQEIAKLAPLNTFSVNSSSLQEGTLKALYYLVKHRKLLKNTSIFFLDGHLVLFAFCWVFLRFWIHPTQIGLLYLKGPERINSYWLTRRLTIWLVSLKEVVLYLRTEELQQDWQFFFSSIDNDKIRTIPSLELSNTPSFFRGREKRKERNQQVAFGVIGQIRRGKGLEWLVPLFKKSPEIGNLIVSGTFYDESEAKLLPELNNFDGFQNAFLSESDMLACAMQQDYLLMLYDHWDERMESAILYLAAKAGRPVITYNKGWCGRKVALFGCGLLVPDGEVDLGTFLSSVPRPRSKEYNDLVNGVERFVKAHSGEAVRAEFLGALLE